MAAPNSAPGFAGFQGPDAPAEADMYRCVHCGLCLSSCPTYVETRMEMESPRGRIALMKAVNEGRVEITPRIVSHWEACLQCRACEAVCPSGVPYGRMMEHTRAQVRAHNRQSAGLGRVSRLFLRGALPHPGRLRFGAGLIRLYQRSGVQWLLRRSKLLRLVPGGLARMEAQLPPLSGRFFGPSPTIHPARGDRRMTVALLSGCVMPLMQGPTMESAVRVLTHNGCDVAVPPGQGCCGALNMHAGDLDAARAMARRNIDALTAAGAERIVTASAGCGSAMKDYHDLLQDDPDYAERARTFSQQTVDITELLVDLPLRAPAMPLPRKVTYQDPCHLAHAQRITKAPTDHFEIDSRLGINRNGELRPLLRRRWHLLNGATGTVGKAIEAPPDPNRRHRRRRGSNGQPRLRTTNRDRPESPRKNHPGTTRSRHPRRSLPTRRIGRRGRPKSTKQARRPEAKPGANLPPRKSLLTSINVATQARDSATAPALVSLPGGLGPSLNCSPILSY